MRRDAHLEEDKEPIPNMRLEGRKVLLREFRREDLPLAVEYLNHPDVAAGQRIVIPFPYRIEDVEKWFESLDAHSEKAYAFAIEEKSSGTFIGGCGLEGITPHHRSAEGHIWLGFDFWSKGYGTEAVTLLVDFGFSQINLNKIKMCPFAFNARAIACYEKVGFKEEGRLQQEIFRNGEFVDQVMMRLLQSEYSAGPEANG